MVHPQIPDLGLNPRLEDPRIEDRAVGGEEFPVPVHYVRPEFLLIRRQQRSKSSDQTSSCVFVRFRGGQC